MVLGNWKRGDRVNIVHCFPQSDGRTRVASGLPMEVSFVEANGDRIEVSFKNSGLKVYGGCYSYCGESFVYLGRNSILDPHERCMSFATKEDVAFDLGNTKSYDVIRSGIARLSKHNKKLECIDEISYIARKYLQITFY